LAASDIFQSALAGGASRIFRQNMPESARAVAGDFPVFLFRNAFFPDATDYFACCGETVSLSRPTGNLPAAPWECFVPQG
jgi:hypothetical protein